MTTTPFQKLKAAARQWSYNHDTGEFKPTNANLRFISREGYDSYLEVKVGGKTKKIKAKRLGFFIFNGYCPVNYSIEFKDGDRDNLAADNFYLAPIGEGGF